MPVRAIRGAVQLDADHPEHLLSEVEELVREVISANELSPEDLISILFTTTPDLTSEFPALAARRLGLGDVPLLCASEIAVEGAMPRVVRLLAHAEMAVPRSDVRHIYRRGAVALRRDLAQ